VSTMGVGMQVARCRSGRARLATGPGGTGRKTANSAAQFHVKRLKVPPISDISWLTERVAAGHVSRETVEVPPVSGAFHG
jgi:hypothetical protein